MSTAFERVMRERGDLDVLHEPFMYHYYLNNGHRLYPNFEPSPDHPRTYVDIKAMIMERASDRAVFVKDMAYYVIHEIPQDLEFLDKATHTFLVRDPAEALLSYAKLDPDFSEEETGFEALWKLYSFLRENDYDPLVVRSNDVRSDPLKAMRRYWDHASLSDMPAALSWDNSTPQDWKQVEDWHKDAITSGAIRPPEINRDYLSELARLGERYIEIYERQKPFYDRLAAQANS